LVCRLQKSEDKKEKLITEVEELKNLLKEKKEHKEIQKKIDSSINAETDKE